MSTNHSGTSITGGHANAVAAGAAGFMTGADKTKIDALPASQAAIQALIDDKVQYLGFWGCAGNPATTAARWMPRIPSSAVATTSVGLFIPAFRAMTLVSITAAYSNAVQATDNITYTVDLNSVITALSVTLTPSTASATGTHAGIAVAAGDNLSIRVVQSGSAASTAGCLVGVSIGYKSA